MLIVDVAETGINRTVLSQIPTTMRKAGVDKA
jgi:hypothetical protein